MPILPRSNPSLLTVIAVTLVLAACGGGDATPAATSAAAPTEFATKGGGGGTTTPPLPNPLPTTAPAPDILVRESFGMGPDIVRPAGGKGALKTTYVHTTIGGFWVEWPGQKGAAWITPDGNQTWKFCGTNPSPYELPSPLQGTAENGYFNAGCAASEWFDLPITQFPTALLPFTAPAGKWQVSMEGYPSVVEGAYVALGLSNSAVTLSNFTSSGLVWLGLRKQEVMVNGPLVYELRLNGRSGALLASGVVDDETWNRMVIAYDPATQALTASINGVALGPFTANLGAPKYAGFEGVGILDNFVIRRLP